MKIGIDIDDTITDTSLHFIKFVAEYFKLDKNYLKENNIFYINLPEELKDKRQEFEKFIYKKELYKIPIKNFAIQAINLLKERGHKIIIITARDNKNFDYPYEQTIKQLRFHGIKYDKIICGTNKGKICEEEKIDIMLDDSITNLTNIKKIVKYVFLFTSPYNKNLNVQFERVDSWKKFYKEVLKLEKSI